MDRHAGLKQALNGGLGRLSLPSEEVCPVIGHCQADISHVIRAFLRLHREVEPFQWPKSSRLKCPNSHTRFAIADKPSSRRRPGFLLLLVSKQVSSYARWQSACHRNHAADILRMALSRSDGRPRHLEGQPGQVFTTAKLMRVDGGVKLHNTLRGDWQPRGSPEDPRKSPVWLVILR